MNPNAKKCFSRFLFSALSACLILGLSGYVMGQQNGVQGKTATSVVSKVNSAASLSRDTKLDGFTLIRDYNFGTAEGNTVHDSTELTGILNAYGIAGTNVINSEWQRYQLINLKNHAISTNDLELTAVSNLGGIQGGAISSGQITTKETFQPTVGKTVAFQTRAKIPKEKGAWPAFGCTPKMVQVPLLQRLIFLNFFIPLIKIIMTVLVMIMARV